MELLQLILSVVAALGAGAMGALFVARREEKSDRELHVTERLQELEHRTAVDRGRLERISETVSAGDRDLRNRLQAALVARDERFEAFGTRIHRLEQGIDDAPPGSPPRLRLEARINDTAGRIESVTSEVAALDRRVQAKLIGFRDNTQDVLRKLAEHQIEEAERVTKLTRAIAVLNERVEAAIAGGGGEDAPPTTAAIVEVLEAQVVLTERASDLEARIDEGLVQLERHLADIETRVMALDELRPQLGPTDLPAKAESGRPRAAAPTSTRLEQIFGIGPKLAKKLQTEGVADVRALAALTEGDLDRLSQRIRGFKERQIRHDWVSQARRLVDTLPNLPVSPAISADPAAAAGAGEGSAPSPSNGATVATPDWPTRPVDPDSIH